MEVEVALVAMAGAQAPVEVQVGAPMEEVVGEQAGAQVGAPARVPVEADMLPARQVMQYLEVWM